MIFAATCAALVAALASVSPGETIRFADTCPASVTIKRVYDPPITIEAAGSDVAGLVVTGGGVTWRGGTLRARDGEAGIAQAGYAASVRNAKRITIEGVRFISFNRGLAIGNSTDVAARFNSFEQGQDGIIVSGGARLDFSHNRFLAVSMVKTKCTVGAGIQRGLSSASCKRLGGAWTDGWHQDAIQYRNGIQGLTIIGNVIEGVEQGIGNMDSPADARVRGLLIDGNTVAVSGYHAITDGGSVGDMLITRNDVSKNVTPGRKSPIRAGAGAVVCGNVVARAGDPGGDICGGMK